MVFFPLIGHSAKKPRSYTAPKNDFSIPCLVVSNRVIVNVLYSVEMYKKSLR